MPERLQKILAQAGYGSRRTSEDFISAGRVRVNGQVATLSQKADPTKDKITVDGKPLAAVESLTYIELYKPRNVLSTVESRNIFINRLPETLEITHCGLSFSDVVFKSFSWRASSQTMPHSVAHEHLTPFAPY